MSDINILDTRFFSNVREAGLAFARAAGINGGVAPKHFGKLTEQRSVVRTLAGPFCVVPRSPDAEADFVLLLAKLANEAAITEHVASLEGGPDFNPPGKLEMTDDREPDVDDDEGCGPYVRIVWGTGRTVVTLERDFTPGAPVQEWCVGIGYDEERRDWATSSSVVLSMARRIAARDADLHEAEMARELAQVQG